MQLAYSGVNGSNYYTREVPRAPSALPIRTFTNDPVQARALDKADIVVAPEFKADAPATVVPADVAYPTDSGLMARGVARMVALVAVHMVIAERGSAQLFGPAIFWADWGVYDGSIWVGSEADYQAEVRGLTANDALLVCLAHWVAADGGPAHGREDEAGDHPWRHRSAAEELFKPNRSS